MALEAIKALNLSNKLFLRDVCGKWRCLAWHQRETVLRLFNLFLIIQGRSYTTGTHDRATGPGLSNVYKFSVKLIFTENFDSQIKMILCSSQGQMLKTIHKLCFSA